MLSHEDVNVTPNIPASETLLSEKKQDSDAAEIEIPDVEFRTITEMDTDDEEPEDAADMFETCRTSFKLIYETYDRTLQDLEFDVLPIEHVEITSFQPFQHSSELKVESKGDLTVCEKLGEILIRTQTNIKLSHEKLIENYSEINDDLSLTDVCRHSRNIARHMRLMSHQMHKLVSATPITSSENQTSHVKTMEFMEKIIRDLNIVTKAVEKYLAVRKELIQKSRHQAKAHA